MRKPTQRDHRRGVDVDGTELTTVSSAGAWYRCGRFNNDDEARGAFRLAYEQAMDGMGESVAKWMGITEQELAAWRHDETLPKKR